MTRRFSFLCIGTLVAVAATLPWLGGCSSSLPVEAFADMQPRFSPMDFFDGRTTSWGVLETSGGAPSRVFDVTSTGHRDQSGDLVLEQAIHWHDGAVDHRTWHMHSDDGRRFTATLTDASGPVTGEAAGPLLHLSYPMKAVPGGRMEQWLYLQSDGRTLMNVGTVRVFGVTVARLSERITREGDAS